ncbi:hypothetical protein ACJX0J_018581, partial [Zea mays]
MPRRDSRVLFLLSVIYMYLVQTFFILLVNYNELGRLLKINIGHNCMHFVVSFFDIAYHNYLDSFLFILLKIVLGPRITSVLKTLLPRGFHVILKELRNRNACMFT